MVFILIHYAMIAVVIDGGYTEVANGSFDKILHRSLPIVKFRRLNDRLLVSMYYNDVVEAIAFKSSIIGAEKELLKNPKTYVVRDSGIVYHVWKYDNGVTIVIGDVGIVYFKYNDGHSLPIKTYDNTSFLKDQIFNVIQPRPYKEFNLTYNGTSGEEVRIARGGIVYPSGTVKDQGVSVSYENPYDIYYIYLGGLRIVYPIKIRGVDQEMIIHSNMSNSITPYLKAQYLEAFIPYSPAIVKRVNVTGEIIDEIIGKYSGEAGVDPNSVKLYDIYLAISKDYNYLLPTLKIGSPGSSLVIWYQLTPEGKIVVYEKAVLAGSPSGPDTGSLVDLDKILSRNGDTGNLPCCCTSYSNSWSNADSVHPVSLDAWKETVMPFQILNM